MSASHTSGHGSLYGYIPTESVCILFIALFGLSTLMHIGQAIYYRIWWLLPTVCLAGLGEVIGWIGRLWSSQAPRRLDPYLMQITSTIIAPTPLVAANFIILGSLITILGPQYSRLSPAWYSIAFCSADIIALVVQAIGGASASEAVEIGRDPAKGGHIMLGGIAFQMVSITVYVAMASEFLIRYHLRRPIPRRDIPSQSPTAGKLDSKIKLMLLGLSLSTVCIFIRAVYRTIELSNGWTGRIIHTQVLFNVLDGAMILIAMYTINGFHPGFLLHPVNLVQKRLIAEGGGKRDIDSEVPSIEGQEEKFPETKS